MKLQIIRKIGRHATAIFLITGICLLTSKGIVPTGMITLLLLAGGFFGFLFRILVIISSVHCRIICRITQNINIHIWKQLL